MISECPGLHAVRSVNVLFVCMIYRVYEPLLSLSLDLVVAEAVYLFAALMPILQYKA